MGVICMTTSVIPHPLAYDIIIILSFLNSAKQDMISCMYVEQDTGFLFFRLCNSYITTNDCKLQKKVLNSEFVSRN